MTINGFSSNVTVHAERAWNTTSSTTRSGAHRLVAIAAIEERNPAASATIDRASTQVAVNISFGALPASASIRIGRVGLAARPPARGEVTVDRASPDSQPGIVETYICAEHHDAQGERYRAGQGGGTA